jgi:hypothetical protein
VSKRENSSLILQNLKKRELRPLGEPVVPLAEAERRLSQSTQEASADALTAATAIASSETSTSDSTHASYHDGEQAVQHHERRATRLKPRERVARSALIVRLDPALHRELEEVARFNRLTMNDITIEAIELHLKNFPHPGDDSRDGDKR